MQKLENHIFSRRCCTTKLPSSSSRCLISSVMLLAEDATHAYAALNLVSGIKLYAVAELDMGHFFVTQPDPTQDFSDPTRPGACQWICDRTRPSRDRPMKNIVNLFCVQRIICRPVAYNILQCNCNVTAMSAIQLLLR